jgi:hypothetical protein
VSFPPSLPVAIDALSGVPLLVLAALVARVRPRRKASLAFAAFAGGFGAAFVVVNLVDVGDPLREALQLVATPLYLAGVAGALALVCLFPRPLRRDDRGLVAALVVFSVVHLVARLMFPLTVGLEMITAFFSFAQIVALPLLALRFRAAMDEPRVQAQVALVTAAFLTYAAVQTGVSFGRVMQGFTPSAMGWANYTTIALVGLLWLANTTLPGSAARTARNVALLVPALVLVGMVSVVAQLVPETGAREGFSGTLRGVSAALLAYAILRYQWLDLDVKVKWTVKQSTIAAAFIGVFFVVSESASTFFSSEAGLGPYLGIAAAGVLVFALAPLQRAAERVADATMPGVKPLGELSQDERVRLYRDQARAAWADGALSRDERVLLDQLREGLGLGLEEAARLEREAAA